MSAAEIATVHAPRERGKGEPWIELRVSVCFYPAELRAITGLSDLDAIAAWLASQIEPLQEMLADGDARETMLGYLRSYAEIDREDGELPP